MSVIYETKEDFEKAKLSEQAKDLQLKSSHESGLGMAFIGLGIAADNYNLRKPSFSGKLAWVSGFLQLFGLVETVKSFFTSSKAHDRIHELERMGPQVFAMPHDNFSPSVSDFGVADKIFTQNIQPTAAIDPRSLFEHAEKPIGSDKSI